MRASVKVNGEEVKSPLLRSIIVLAQSGLLHGISWIYMLVVFGIILSGGTISPLVGMLTALACLVALIPADLMVNALLGALLKTNLVSLEINVDL